MLPETTNLSETAEKAINAYGGIAFWQQARKLEAIISVKGLAFTLKRRPFFKFARVSMDVHQPISRITPIGQKSSISGILDGGDVRLENRHGEIVSERQDARRYFSSVRRLFHWDDLDMAYFANYASWNYFTLPALLMRQDISWKEQGGGVLNAEFPPEVPTHSRQQRFIFDKETGRLRQHNYTADIISRFAKAANVVLSHSEENGLVFPSVRRVSPRKPNGLPARHPELINIQVHNYALSS